MNEFAERIERDFPVRRKEKEKVDFRTWLVYTLQGARLFAEARERDVGALGGRQCDECGRRRHREGKDRSRGALRHRRARGPAAAHLPDATGDVHALRGADASAGAGGELPYFVRRDVRAQHAEYDAAALFTAAWLLGSFTPNMARAK